MIRGIQEYVKNTNSIVGICATDIKDRGFRDNTINYLKYNEDFLSDEYISDLPVDIDYVIMNPPYSLIEPFVIRSLEIASKGVIMLARLQFLEGESRYNNILKNTPPTDVYIYVDRISCLKNGINKTGNAQAYAWFYWNKEKDNKQTLLHWIRRNDKIQN